MTHNFSRKDILSLFHERLESGEKIFGFGAGCGMTAKSAEKGGADFISIYTTAFCRIEGIPSFMAWLPYGDCNEEMRKMSPKMLPIIRNTPVIAGLGAHDHRLNLQDLIKEFIALGYSGVSNEPFCSTYGKEFSDTLTKMGIGFNRELELIRTAHDMDILTLGWAADAGEAEALVDAGADMIGLLAGGEPRENENFEQFLQRTFENIKHMNQVVKDIDNNVITLVHGGPISNPDITARAIAVTGVDGSASGSGGERLSAEEAIINIVKDYKSIRG